MFGQCYKIQLCRGVYQKGGNTVTKGSFIGTHLGAWALQSILEDCTGDLKQFGLSVPHRNGNGSWDKCPVCKAEEEDGWGGK